jgi:hypothetical protein
VAPRSGSIGGVTVGEAAAEVLTRWGKPDVTGPGVYLYNAGVWTVEVKFTTAGKVTDLLLGWNQTKWPGSNPSNGQVYRPS